MVICGAAGLSCAATRPWLHAGRHKCAQVCSPPVEEGPSEQGRGMAQDCVASAGLPTELEPCSAGTLDTANCASYNCTRINIPAYPGQAAAPSGQPAGEHLTGSSSVHARNLVVWHIQQTKHRIPRQTLIVSLPGREPGSQCKTMAHACLSMRKRKLAGGLMHEMPLGHRPLGLAIQGLWCCPTSCLHLHTPGWIHNLSHVMGFSVHQWHDHQASCLTPDPISTCNPALIYLHPAAAHMA